MRQNLEKRLARLETVSAAVWRAREYSVMQTGLLSEGRMEWIKGDASE